MNINPQSQIRNPKSLWLVRHGESTANIARLRAETEKLLTIDFDEREMDVPLSPVGVEQSIAVGKNFLVQSEKPSVIFCSPFVRTSETARTIAESAGLSNVNIVFDERLREREFGIFDRLTAAGATQKYAEEMAKREKLGKFYYRPSGGESWADVALRARSFLHDLRFDYAGEQVLIVTHEVVIHVLRYILERLTETEILTIDRERNIGNCSVTYYEAENGNLSLKSCNFSA